MADSCEHLDDATIAAMSSAAVFDALFAPGGPGMTPQPSDGGDGAPEMSEEARLEAVAASMAAGMRELAAAEARAGEAAAAAVDDSSDVSLEGSDGGEATDDEVADEADADAKDPSVDDEGDEDDGEGMGYATGTAEGSWGGGEASEWALTAVKRRRKARGGDAASTSAELAAAERDADEERWEYLCEWRGYGSATWERRGFLLDLGFGPEVRAYDASHVATQPRTRAPRPQMPPGSHSANEIRRLRRERSEAKARARRQQQAAAEFRPWLAECLRTNPLVEKALTLLAARSYVSDTVTATGALGDEASASVTSAAAVLMHIFMTLNRLNVAVEHVSFLQPATLATVVNGVNPTKNKSLLVYHGTRPEAVGPISRVGLVVPGEGNKVKVTNGSAYGVGIYTDTNPSTPIGYGGSGGDLFVCIGREDPHSAAYKVFKSSKDVAPFLHLSFTRGSGCGLNFDTDGHLLRLPSLSPRPL